eukprot:3426580-Pleurochrysis_carterae.AAC.1
MDVCCVSTAGSAEAKEGQPVPDSNFCDASKSGVAHPAHRKRPARTVAERTSDGSGRGAAAIKNRRSPA